MKRITIVIEFEDDGCIPQFHAHMKVLGGEIIAVVFDDVITKEEAAADHV
jgi:hypothetical protein